MQERLIHVQPLENVPSMPADANTQQKTWTPMNVPEDVELKTVKDNNLLNGVVLDIGVVSGPPTTFCQLEENMEKNQKCAHKFWRFFFGLWRFLFDWVVALVVQAVHFCGYLVGAVLGMFTVTAKTIIEPVYVFSNDHVIYPAFVMMRATLLNIKELMDIVGSMFEQLWRPIVAVVAAFKPFHITVTTNNYGTTGHVHAV